MLMTVLILLLDKPKVSYLADHAHADSHDVAPTHSVGTVARTRVTISASAKQAKRWKFNKEIVKQYMQRSIGSCSLGSELYVYHRTTNTRIRTTFDESPFSFLVLPNTLGPDV